MGVILTCMDLITTQVEQLKGENFSYICNTKIMHPNQWKEKIHLTPTTDEVIYPDKTEREQGQNIFCLTCILGSTNAVTTSQNT